MIRGDGTNMHDNSILSTHKEFNLDLDIRKKEAVV